MKLTEISLRHLLMFPVFKFFEKFGRKTRVGPSLMLPVLPKDDVRLILEFFSISVLVLRTRLLKALGYIVIVERYVPSTIAALTYIYGKGFLKRYIAALLLRFMSGTLQIRLDINYQTHLQRRETTFQKREWILIQRAIYNRFTPNILSINTESMSLNASQDLIRQSLECKL